MIVHCATTNPGKLREFQRAAPDFDVRPLPSAAEPPEESGATFEENAALKAIHYSHPIHQTRPTVLPGFLFADDSGLEVDALAGAPGVHSARFAGLDATDAANNALLLERLRGTADRTARFVCTIALVHDGELIQTFRGEIEGRLLDEPRGSNGFGYDPLFYYPPFACTFGEASLDDKMRVSHRAQALQAMFTYLRGIAST